MTLHTYRKQPTDLCSRCADKIMAEQQQQQQEILLSGVGGVTADDDTFVTLPSHFHYAFVIHISMCRLQGCCVWHDHRPAEWRRFDQGMTGPCSEIQSSHGEVPRTCR